MFLELNDSTASRDTGRGVARLALPDTLFSYLYPDGTAWDSPLEGGPMATAALPDALPDAPPPLTA